MDGGSGAAVDHYSYADRKTLSDALDLLLLNCDCSDQPWCHAEQAPDDPTLCKMCPSSQRFRMGDKSTYCPFQPGSAIAIGPDGKISYARSPHGSTDYEKSFYEKRGPGRPFGESPHWPQLLEGRNPDTPDGCAPEAPAAAAFRIARVGHGKSPDVTFRVPARDGDAITVDTRTLTCPAPDTCKIPMPRRDFVDRTPMPLEDVEHDLALYEDRQCGRQIVKLEGKEKFACYRDSTLEDLGEFVHGLNSGRPGGLELDTVFVNYGTYLVLFGNDRRADDWAAGYPFHNGQRLYRNAIVLDGVTFFHHEAVPHELGYAMSREQGPVFVHGPTTVSCYEAQVEVERHCAMVAPPDSGVPEVPWGVRFNVEIKHHRDKGSPGADPAT